MSILNLLEKSNKEGLPLPLAHDGATGKPSVTLFFVYLSNILAIASLITLHIAADKITASIMTCIYAITWVILYMFRALQKAKIDFDDKSIELEGEDDKVSDKN